VPIVNQITSRYNRAVRKIIGPLALLTIVTLGVTSVSTSRAQTGGGFGSYSDLVQLAVDGRDGGERLFFLRRNGNILVENGGVVSVYDNGTGTRQIAVDRGTCYALKQNGNLWRRIGDGPWEKIDDGVGSKQIFAKSGGLYVLKDNGNIWQYAGNGWNKIDDGTDTRQVAGDRNNNLYVLKGNGNIWQYAGNGWNKIDDGVGTKQIQATRGVVFALKQNGNIWRYDGQWHQIDNGTGTRRIYASGNHLFIIKNDGSVWHWGQDGWQKLYQDQVESAAIAHGQLYLLRPDGRVVTIAAPR
jgi:hypothetical protein